MYLLWQNCVKEQLIWAAVMTKFRVLVIALNCSGMYVNLTPLMKVSQLLFS